MPSKQGNTLPKAQLSSSQALWNVWVCGPVWAEDPTWACKCTPSRNSWFMGGLSRQRYCCLNWISKESLVKSHHGVNCLYMSILGGVLEQVGDSLEGIMGSWSIWGHEIGHKILGYLRALQLHFLTKCKSKGTTLRFWTLEDFKAFTGR